VDCGVRAEVVKPSWFQPDADMLSGPIASAARSHSAANGAPHHTRACHAAPAFSLRFHGRGCFFGSCLSYTCTARHSDIGTADGTLMKRRNANRWTGALNSQLTRLFGVAFSERHSPPNRTPPIQRRLQCLARCICCGPTMISRCRRICDANIGAYI